MSWHLVIITPSTATTSWLCLPLPAFGGHLTRKLAGETKTRRVGLNDIIGYYTFRPSETKTKRHNEMRIQKGRDAEMQTAKPKSKCKRKGKRQNEIDELSQVVTFEWLSRLLHFPPTSTFAPYLHPPPARKTPNPPHLCDSLCLGPCD